MARGTRPGAGTGRAGGTWAAALGLVLLVPLLGGCDALVTDKTPGRVKDGTAALDLTVTGRPTPGSLATTEHVLARLKDGDAAGLAELAGDGGGTEDDAERWVARWHDAARRPGTAAFSPGGKEAYVEVRFPGERAPLELRLLPEDEGAPYDDRYVVVLRDGA
ncbi:hypothetical protein ACF068_04890 [Streptomyces sp. NPDC016309]|uniref:hypothetical protein n=1 Tax=Streptomyces sp. NPDC016309 TaxID=3364965 RepID=UPI0036FF2C77